MSKINSENGEKDEEEEEEEEENDNEQKINEYEENYKKEMNELLEKYKNAKKTPFGFWEVGKLKAKAQELEKKRVKNLHEYVNYRPDTPPKNPTNVKSKWNPMNWRFRKGGKKSKKLKSIKNKHYKRSRKNNKNQEYKKKYL